MYTYICIRISNIYIYVYIIYLYIRSNKPCGRRGGLGADKDGSDNISRRKLTFENFSLSPCKYICTYIYIHVYIRTYIYVYTHDQILGRQEWTACQRRRNRVRRQQGIGWSIAWCSMRRLSSRPTTRPRSRRTRSSWICLVALCRSWRRRSGTLYM